MNKILNYVVFVLLIFSADICWSQWQESNTGSWNWTLAAIPMGNDKVEGILIDPQDENVWYVSSIDSGLYITRDAGATWKHPLQGRGLDQEGFQIDPANPNIIYATVWDKLYRSADKGRNWQLLYTCPEYIRSLLISAKDHAIYLGPQTTDNNTPGLYKSTDGGASFKHQPFGVSTQNLICWDIEEDPVNGILYAPIEIADHPQPYNPPFFRSMDGGQTWQNISGTLGWHALKVQVDSSSSAVYYQVEGGALYRSANFGQDWQLLHATFFLSFLVDQQNPNRLFGGRPASITGGAYLSLDSGHSFFEIGLAGLTVSSIALNASNTQIYAVAYNSGIWKGHIPEGLGSGVLTVTNTNDSGANTLREAITAANNYPGPDTIRFAIPKSDPGFELQTGAWRIRVLNPLPDITDAGLTIDGSSQNEFTGEDSNPAGPEIIIDGSAAGEFTTAFNILTSDVKIKQLCINGFGDRGISMFGENTRGNTITGCYIGTDAAGKTAKPNDIGIFIQETAANTISGNLISGNDKFGIYIMGAASQNNVISGNLIGTDITGNNDLGNGWTGISINSDKNTIGGSSENKRNIISGNGQDGISIAGNNNTIIGNYIGTDLTGKSAIANKWNGIRLYPGSNNVIGGAGTGESNIISGNQQTGIFLSGAYATKIWANYIGTDAAGTATLPNGSDGISLRSGAHGNVIGGNLISANGGIGVHLSDAGTDSNVVRDNRIGANVSGTDALPNASFGVAIFNGPQHNVIGPTNLVAHNGLDGVLVDGADNLGSTVSNTITANSITANGRRGIENMRGGNLELAPPTILSLTTTEVSGTADAGQTVEVFADEEDEGLLYLGSTSANATGNFVLSLSEPLPPMPYITATSTDTAGNTSQFSQPWNVTSVAETAESTIPEKFSLSQNYPNPFNPTTTINFAVPRKFVGGVKVSLKIFNIEGKMVRSLVDEDKSPGFYSVVWDGKNDEGRKASSGLYFCTVSVGEFRAARKMILLQ